MRLYIPLLRQVHGGGGLRAARRGGPPRHQAIRGGHRRCLLELSPEELVNDIGVSRFQVCSCVCLAHCFFCKKR